MSKIIFSDYDGTLDTSENDITKNIEAIQKFRNMEIYLQLLQGEVI